MSPYLSPSIPRHDQRQPQSRRLLQLAIVASAIGAVAAAGTQTASAHPDYEQGAASSTYTATAPVIVRSNVTVDAYTHETWLYGDRLGAVESGPENVQVGGHHGNLDLYGMRKPR